MTIEDAISCSREFSNRVADTCLGEYTGGLEMLLVGAYYDTALEYHESICVLMEKQHFGSALVLCRPMFEMTAHAFWVAGCATPAQVELLAKRRSFRFPEMHEVVRQVDARWFRNNLFTQMKDAVWAALNSYTHTGLLQLSSRFRRGPDEIGHSSMEIVAAVYASSSWLVLLANLLNALAGRADKLALLTRMTEEYLARFSSSCDADPTIVDAYCLSKIVVWLRG